MGEINYRGACMGCDLNCMNEHRFKKLEEDLKELKEKNSADHKEFYTRIESVEKDMVDSQSDRKHIRDQLDKINNNVETLIQKPGNRYVTIVSCIITAIISVIIGYFLNGVFPV